MDDSSSETLTVYRWESVPYDTQRWQYVRLIPNSTYTRLGEVHRVIRARQSFDEPVHEYHAFSFTTNQKQTFNTRAEAEAWVTACERMT